VKAHLDGERGRKMKKLGLMEEGKKRLSIYKEGRREGATSSVVNLKRGDSPQKKEEKDK